MSSKTKTLLLLTSGYPLKGVSEPYLIDEIKYLSKSFSKILVVPINDITSKELIEIPGNVECFFPTIEAKPIASQTLILKLLFTELIRLLKSFNFIKQIRYHRSYLVHKLKLASSIHFKLKSDSLLDGNLLVYSYWFSEPALVGAILKSYHPHLKLISKGHGYDIFEEQSAHNYLPFKPFKFKLIDELYSVSKRGAEYLALQFPNYKSKITYSYLGTADNGLAPFTANQVFSIVTCSNVRGIKRLHLMPDILKRIKFNVTWHVLGNGNELERIKDLCRSLPHNITVIFHGYLNSDDIVKFYQSHSINLFMSLSSSEGLPVSMMEAISYGIPLMSTDVGGCKEICNNNTGILIKSNFVSQNVATSISSFKNSDMNCIEFRSKVRAFWKENFSAEKNYTTFTEKLLTN